MNEYKISRTIEQGCCVFSENFYSILFYFFIFFLFYPKFLFSSLFFFTKSNLDFFFFFFFCFPYYIDTTTKAFTFSPIDILISIYITQNRSNLFLLTSFLDKKSSISRSTSLAKNNFTILLTSTTLSCNIRILYKDTLSLWEKSKKIKK